MISIDEALQITKSNIPKPDVFDYFHLFHLALPANFRHLEYVTL